ncbi:MAG: type I-E CRISPR-associated protein Cas6/Cse3/CasE [Erysipelotrichia bacterium]|nr:type I-E CRISPR-associated protein Cas6/Cse3/CasE [Candidatus Riflebacteria bacterium]NCB40172.1 type I-E CRISPR-associated protein Cas6/Cse3/CasE [Erysipelotrichia bacterium]
MYQSKFLINRQKIFNPCDIRAALSSYFAHLSQHQRDSFFYRLEWYKIGVVIPLIVYSKGRPEMKIMPECQLLETGRLSELPADTKTLGFSIFAVPPFLSATASSIDEKQVTEWLQNELSGAAVICDSTFGPNNCIYFEKDGNECQQQTVTIKGNITITDLRQLEAIRCTPLGQAVELGCGLLHLQEN